MMNLFDFIKNCPTAFHTVDTISRLLLDNNFIEINENKRFSLEKGRSYFCTRNGSSIIAFRIGSKVSQSKASASGYSFRIIASHSDFPSFKLKEKPDNSVGAYCQLNTEGYGGMICNSWMDRPLSVAGRLITRESDGFHNRLFNIDRDLLLIPSMAIHMNRKVNEGVAYNKQVDMLPLIAMNDDKCEEKWNFKAFLADELKITTDIIYGMDAFLYNRQSASVWGAGNEFISAPRLDDLQCAYATLQGFLNFYNNTEDDRGNQTPEDDFDNVISVYACFDNEEVGSSTRQGAASSFMEDIFKRINGALGFDEEELHCALAKSFMISADNAHSVHPNHPEKTDKENCVYMNRGIVVKSNAAQKYSTDAKGIALCRYLCEKAEIPIQFFANRSDEAGGSTLGNIAICRVPVCCVDIGLAQLAMHSAYETAGEKDTEYMSSFAERFYGEDSLAELSSL